MLVNKSIKTFFIRVKPELVISGHLHENARKKDEIGKIKILKCWAFW
jgi:Icc-related predicted phosphoesterase